MSAPITAGDLADHLRALPAGRHLIGIVGAPGSGKSTLAETLARPLGDRAAVIPMDGFHLDDRILNARGHRPRKGAPHTYDVDGLRHLLLRLRANEGDIAIPVFDREIELSRAAAAIVAQDTDILLVEGNYLLLDTPPWDALGDLFDTTVMLDVPEPVLRDRLAQRWIDLGLDDDAVTAKLEENDLPNGRTVRAGSRAADFVVT